MIIVTITSGVACMETSSTYIFFVWSHWIRWSGRLQLYNSWICILAPASYAPSFQLHKGSTNMNQPTTVTLPLLLNMHPVQSWSEVLFLPWSDGSLKSWGQVADFPNKSEPNEFISLSAPSSEHLSPLSLSPLVWLPLQSGILPYEVQNIAKAAFEFGFQNGLCTWVAACHWARQVFFS